MRKLWSWLCRWAPTACAAGAYLALTATGVLTFFAASPTLVQRGGYIIVVCWAVFCIAGGLFGVAGLLTSKVLVRLVGAALSATTGMVWFVALALQAADRISAGVGACLGLVMTLLFAQRWVDAYRASRR